MTGAQKATAELKPQTLGLVRILEGVMTCQFWLSQWQPTFPKMFPSLSQVPPLSPASSLQVPPLLFNNWLPMSQHIVFHLKEESPPVSLGTGVTVRRHLPSCLLQFLMSHPTRPAPCRILHHNPLQHSNLTGASQLRNGLQMPSEWIWSWSMRLKNWRCTAISLETLSSSFRSRLTQSKLRKVPQFAQRTSMSMPESWHQWKAAMRSNGSTKRPQRRSGSWTKLSPGRLLRTRLNASGGQTSHTFSQGCSTRQGKKKSSKTLLLLFHCQTVVRRMIFTTGLQRSSKRTWTGG